MLHWMKDFETYHEKCITKNNEGTKIHNEFISI